MKPVDRPVKLFVSFDLASKSVATDVIARLRKAGADVQDVYSLTNGSEYSNQVREALRASDVVIAVMTSEKLNANVLFELGAAVGAGKPIVALVSGVSNVQLPLDALILPISRAD